MTVFGEGYASSYDTFYAHKDYAAECDAIETLLREVGGQVQEVLDVGCGTGGHAFELAERGYKVTGLDLSAQMLNRARDKVQEGARLAFVQGDARTFSLDRRFDAILMMFAVLGYQNSNLEVIQTLQNARRHAAPNAPFLFDVWFGPGVLAQRPASRMKVIQQGQSTIIRSSDGHLDVNAHLCRVEIEVWRLEGNQLAEHYKEQHVLRFFFPRELELLLERSGFELVRLAAWPDVSAPLDETSWNVAGLARAV